MADFSRLTKKTLSTSPAHRRLQRDDLGFGTVLAFDQSLGTPTSGGTGWVMVVRNHPGVLRVWDAGMFKGLDTGTVRGPEMSVQRGLGLYQSLDLAMIQSWSMLRNSAFEVVYETPPVGGGMARPESSLMAALAIQIWAANNGLDTMMLPAQRAKILICGNGNATKREAHAALAECKGWIMDYDRFITNEAHRDALLLALTWLARRRIREVQ